MPLYNEAVSEEATIVSQTAIDPESYQQFSTLLMEGDRRVCMDIVDAVVAQGTTVMEIYERLFRPALYEVGERWERNEISVATEHVASAMVEFLMSRLYPGVVSDFRCGKSVVVACTERELHQIGAKMVCDVFEMNGWDATFVGADVSHDNFLRMLDEVRPHLCALSLSVYMNVGTFVEMISKVRSRFPNMPILVGGQALQTVALPFRENYPGVTHLHSLNDVDAFLKRHAAV